MRAPFSTMLSGLVGAVALLGLASCSTTVASAPSQPAYDSDVRPILMAHCARCHGAGDAINVPTQPTGPDAAVQPGIANNVSTLKSTNLYFDRYHGDGTKQGAYEARLLIPVTLPPKAKYPLLMPPAPAPGLADWEVDVLNNWLGTGAPCSLDPNPDQTICPPAP